MFSDRVWGLRRLGAVLLLTVAAVARADGHADNDAVSALFSGPIDPRGKYSRNWFPEPLRAPEGDFEEGQLRFDWFHNEKRHRQADAVSVEAEFGIGGLTLEAQVAYQKLQEGSRDPVTRLIVRESSEGVDDIELSARYPLYHHVSADGGFEYALVGGLEVGVPSGSRISRDDFNFAPQAYQLFRFGEHLSVQTNVGLWMVVGPHEGGLTTLEYSAVVGYDIERSDLAIPSVRRVCPLFELNGERPFSGEENGINRLFGTAGFRVNLKAVGPVQPRIGVGYTFPIDKGAREELRWGITTSVVLEF